MRPLFGLCNTMVWSNTMVLHKPKRGLISKAHLHRLTLYAMISVEYATSSPQNRQLHLKVQQGCNSRRRFTQEHTLAKGGTLTVPISQNAWPTQTGRNCSAVVHV